MESESSSSYTHSFDCKKPLQASPRRQVSIDAISLRTDASTPSDIVSGFFTPSDLVEVSDQFLQSPCRQTSFGGDVEFGEFDVYDSQVQGRRSALPFRQTSFSDDIEVHEFDVDPDTPSIMHSTIFPGFGSNETTVQDGYDLEEIGAAVYNKVADRFAEAAERRKANKSATANIGTTSPSKITLRFRESELFQRRQASLRFVSIRPDLHAARGS